MKAMAATLSKPGMYRFAGRAGRWFMRHMPWLLNNKLNPWYKQREMPAPPAASFREWYIKNKKKLGSRYILRQILLIFMVLHLINILVKYK